MASLKSARCSTGKDYEPTKRCFHSTVIVGDCLYMWGGEFRHEDTRDYSKDEIPGEKKESSFVEVLHLLTGRWVQKYTTGDPPLGIMDYAAAAIGNEIFYLGGRWRAPGDYDYYKYNNDNVLYSLNVDTLKWRKVIPTNPEDGPKRKYCCCMIAVKIEGEDYLVIIEGVTINIYYIRIATGQWISVLTGGGITGINEFQLISLDDTSAIILQADERCDISASAVYHLTFTKRSVVYANIFKKKNQDKYHDYQNRHCVLLNNPPVLKLLVISNDECETFDINRTNWKKVAIPGSFKERSLHSLSVWNEDTTNIWIIEFGGEREVKDPESYYACEREYLSDTRFLNITYTKGNISVSPYTLKQYQEEMEERKRPLRKEISQKGEKEIIMEERHQQEIQQLHLQMKERDQQARERERGMERQKKRELQQKDQQFQEMEREKERELQEIQRESQQSKRRLQRQLQERERQFQERERQLQREKERELQEMRRESQERERQLQGQFQERERQLQQEVQELRIQNDDMARQLQEREQQLQQLHQLENKDSGELEEQESAWVVNGDEIRMTETVLGNGGYGEVRVAKFRGLRVAAKSLHRVILSPYNRRIFSREMEIASKVRHPNLLQFIGATREGNPIILTELMPTSLRKELETGFPLSYPAILSIGLDVACALNYLHLFKPHPIIHRDISSGNVLLQTTAHMGIGWRAKVSDYGSANLQNLIATTENPGNRVYSAPEAGNPREHSPAMDVFSYGVLLIEMSICAIPQPGNRRQDVNSIRRAGFKNLVQRCVMDNCELRPKMSDVINELTQNI